MLDNIIKDNINEAIRILQNGGLIIFPTETVYALACDAASKPAIEKLSQLKMRDAGKPFSIMVSSLHQVKKIALIDAKITRLFKELTPGPITIICNAKQSFKTSPATIGIRIPDNIIALTILKKFKKPIIATSVNKTSKPSATSIATIDKELLPHIDYIINGGKCELGISSTIVDMTKEMPNFLREGNIKYEKILATINNER
jgi:tRNA threonylcarbamoyl adenosine modification protein (Sua5/YciO/YrdC/YwlC family)